MRGIREGVRPSPEKNTYRKWPLYKRLETPKERVSRIEAYNEGLINRKQNNLCVRVNWKPRRSVVQ